MIIEPFEPFVTLGYLFTDIQDLDTNDRRLVAIALRDGLQQIEGGDRCAAFGMDPDGEYPIMIFGVKRAGNLVGAWWIGCNEKLPGSTPTDILLRSVPHPGWVPGNFDNFFNATETVKIGKQILNKSLSVRGGGTVTVKEFTFTSDTANPDFGPLPDTSSLEAKGTAGLVVVETPEGSRTRYTISRVGP